MANFTKGQRVRVRKDAPDSHACPADPRGLTGTITYNISDDRLAQGRVGVLMDAPFPPEPLWGAWATEPQWLEPLTPPAEDAWASEQVRKVCKPQPEFTTLRELLEVPRETAS